MIPSRQWWAILAATAFAMPVWAQSRSGELPPYVSPWTGFYLGGALGAGRIGSPQAFGLDVVGPAAFLARRRTDLFLEFIALGPFLVDPGIVGRPDDRDHRRNAG